MVDWPGLLAWSTKYHDGTSDTSQFTEMSKEDKDFLIRAMEEMFSQIEDPNKIFKDAVDKLREEHSEEQAITTLEIIDRCCDDPDVARNVEVHDGLTPLLGLLDSPNSHVAARSCEVLGLIVANNPIIQRAALDKHALEKLMEPLDMEDVLRSRGKIRLLSALVRHEAHLEIEFVRRNGLTFIGDCMTCGDEYIVARAASLLNHLIEMERAPATGTTATYIARAVSDLKTTSIERGEILSACARVHSLTKSRGLRDALKTRLAYIYERDDTTSFKQEMEILLETIRLLE